MLALFHMPVRWLANKVVVFFHGENGGLYKCTLSLYFVNPPTFGVCIVYFVKLVVCVLGLVQCLLMATLPIKSAGFNCCHCYFNCHVHIMCVCVCASL